MTNEDQRVQQSERMDEPGEGFFVDITPPEFEDRPAGQLPTPAPTEVDTPDQESFVEQRFNSAPTKYTDELFFRTPKANSLGNGKTEAAIKLTSDNRPTNTPILDSQDPTDITSGAVVTAPVVTEGIEPVADTSDPSETTTEDISDPLADAEPISVANGLPPTEINVDNSSVDDGLTNGQLEQKAIESAPAEDLSTGSAEPVGVADSQAGMPQPSPAQIQLAELRSKLAEMNQPSISSTDGSGDAHLDPTTNEHPIGGALQAKLELEETADEVYPPGYDEQPQFSQEAPNASAYFPTPDQKKAHAKFLPPDQVAPARNSTEVSPQMNTRSALLPSDSHSLDSLPAPVRPETGEPEQFPLSESSEVTGEYAPITGDPEALRPGSAQSTMVLAHDSGVASDLQRDRFFTASSSHELNESTQGNGSDQNRFLETDPTNAEEQQSSTDPSLKEFDDQRQRRPFRRGQDDYRVIGRSGGQYDYDHEYYAASKSKLRRNEPSSDGIANADRPVSSQGSRDTNPPIGAGNRVRWGRAIFVLCVVSLVGAFLFAGTIDLINFNELKQLVSSSSAPSVDSSIDGVSGGLAPESQSFLDQGSFSEVSESSSSLDFSETRSEKNSSAGSDTR